MQTKLLSISVLVSLLLLTACATFYEINYEFNQNFERGNIEQANTVLDKNKKRLNRKTSFLYQVNKGVVTGILNDFETSNLHFEEAYLFGEDYSQNYLNLAASFLVNPTLTEYKGEDHEHLLVLYYKALNYLKLNDYESALVECRRLNNRLNALDDKYKSENKYKRDAFINNLMGIIYEASGDFNNAFIAYRNAYNVYKEDYAELFFVIAPDQLKLDLMRTAYLNGFNEELDFYEKEFDQEYVHQPQANGELVFLWHNGLGPVKDEWSVNFTIIDGGPGIVTFENSDMGFSFPFTYDYDDDDDSFHVTDLDFFRVAFPKYVERSPTHERARLTVGGQSKELELAQNVNNIAFQVLRQRMIREFGQSLLRAALKKATEQAVESENEGLGLLVGIVNALTEKADTRNWQTLPHSIYYTRLPLDAGNNQVNLTLQANGRSDQNVQFNFEGRKGKTVFHTYQTLY